MGTMRLGGGMRYARDEEEAAHVARERRYWRYKGAAEKRAATLQAKAKAKITLAPLKFLEKPE